MPLNAGQLEGFWVMVQPGGLQTGARPLFLRLPLLCSPFELNHHQPSISRWTLTR